MNKIIISVLSVILVMSAISFAYYCGKNQQEWDDYHLYGHYFSERTLELKSHFSEMGIKPDSIHYCDKCKQIFIEYPGIEPHEHKPEVMHEITKVFKPLR